DSAYKGVTWSSSNASVATVSQSGLVYAVGPGTAVITATSSYDGSTKGTKSIAVSSYSTGAMVGLNSGRYALGHGSSVTGLSPFHISKYEVTRGLYRTVMGSDPSKSGTASGEIADNQPADSMTWYQAVEFCNRLSEIEGFDKCYAISGTSVACDFSKNGYRLPTETEWEYAASGGNNSYAYSGSNAQGDVEWYSANSSGKTHAVGLKAANGYGLYDMSGNVWEWCWDWYDSSYGGYGLFDYCGPSSGTQKLQRGGGYIGNTDHAVTYRRNFDPSSALGDGGFRVARSIPKYSDKYMVKVDGGNYAFGHGSSTTTISPFYISKYQITQYEWNKTMGGSKTFRHTSSPEGINSRLPAEYVSWIQAVTFCNALSVEDGYEPCYTINGTNVDCDWTKNGYRLPTETEWEYAASGGNNSYTYSGSNDYAAVGWFENNSDNRTHEIGLKAANGYGLYDMSGNVWEWCWDLCSDRRPTVYGGFGATNYRGASSGSYRALRGGTAWNTIGSTDFPGMLTFRYTEVIGNECGDVGLRIVRSAM
ncbi:MAG TPA: hypothetical protein DCO86_03275, partial [Spirochaetaceae bacterium]|nr:hypothetical protein [Spirochaetaceae bacterium]